jgi:hypothetical protein
LRYLDLLSDWGCVCHWTQSPEVALGAHSRSCSGPPQPGADGCFPVGRDSAESLLRYALYLQKVSFTNTGSEAVEAS